MQDNNKNNTTPKVTKTDLESGSDKALANSLSDFGKARKYIQDHYQSVWADCFKAYNGIRTRRGYEGVADDFVPETFSIVESLKSSIAGTKPKFKYVPINEEQEQDTTTLNALVDYYWSRNNMTEKMLNWVGDMIIYGNGVFMVSWEKNYPLIQHIPLSDFFVDPAATHMNRPEDPGYPRYAGYRYLTSIEELRADRVINVETGELESRFKNLDEIGGGTDSDDMDKTRKEQYIGSTFGKDAIDEQVEVIVYYTRQKKIMVANRKTLILDEKNPYQKDAQEIKHPYIVDGEPVIYTQKIPEIQGFLPFAILRNYVDSNLFFARGDVEVILPTQEALNDTANQKRDNVAYALNNMWQIDPRFKHLAEQIHSAPGNVFPIPKGALTPIEKESVDPSADGEIQRLTQQMRTATAADAAVQGIQQQFSRTTATEVQAQLQQASMRFTTKIQTLEDEGFAQLSRILYKMIQIFVTQEISVRIIGKQGVEWMKYNPERYTDEYEPRVVLEATADAENAALAQSMQVASQFSLGNPIVNQREFLGKMYHTLFGKHMSDDDIEAMLTVETPPMMGPDGQPLDPALTQSDAQITPGAKQFLAGEGQSRGGGTSQGKRQQTGKQGGGGADSSSNNTRRPRANQPSTTLSASSRPR